MLELFEFSLEAAQRSSATENAAVDLPLKIATLQEQVRGHAFTKATPVQIKGEPESSTQSNSILQRCFLDGIIESRHFAVQRGLARIGFNPKEDVTKLGISFSG